MTYAPNAFTDPGAQKRLKYFRWYSRQSSSSERPHHIKFWVVEDEAIAKQLGMQTSEDSHGDVYTIKEAETPFNLKKANIEIQDFPFTSERLLKYTDMDNDNDRSFVRIV